jgi:hypothetical protein
MYVLLCLHLAGVHSDNPDTRVVEEMGVCAGWLRVDIAASNGEPVGSELKSDRDTLQRLPFQSEIYSRVFDRVELVAGEPHLKPPRRWFLFGGVPASLRLR